AVRQADACDRSARGAASIEPVALAPIGNPLALPYQLPVRTRLDLFLVALVLDQIKIAIEFSRRLMRLGLDVCVIIEQRLLRTAQVMAADAGVIRRKRGLDAIHDRCVAARGI